jgi:hypothetical protein
MKSRHQQENLKKFVNYQKAEAQIVLAEIGVCDFVALASFQ